MLLLRVPCADPQRNATRQSPSGRLRVIDLRRNRWRLFAWLSCLATEPHTRWVWHGAIRRLRRPRKTPCLGRPKVYPRVVDRVSPDPHDWRLFCVLLHRQFFSSFFLFWRQFVAASVLRFAVCVFSLSFFCSKLLRSVQRQH